MTRSISENYRRLEAHEVEKVATECADAWLDPNIPGRQWELAVKPELEKYRRGEPVAPFDALVRCLKRLPAEMNNGDTRLLDIGASCGLYREVLEIAGFRYDYRAVDFSPTFKAFAERVYPGILFDVADARDLPYGSGSFDIIVNAAVIMHTMEYERVIAETARVTNSFALFHRTPILTEDPTAFFVKEGYGTPMFEVHFNQDELFGLFDKYGLSCIHVEDVFFDRGHGHREFVLVKDRVVHHQV